MEARVIEAAEYDRLLEVRRTAKVLHDFLWANTGDTADWPVAIKTDNDEDAGRLTGYLNDLRRALKS